MFSDVQTNTLGRILSSFAVSILLLASPTLSPAATSTPAQVVTLGNNTFSISRAATNGFNRDVEVLKTDVQEDAAKYCAAQGKELKVVELTAKRPFFGTGYASAKIVFKALNPGETDQPAAGETSARLSGTGDMYNDLMKLDELRKKGILTDDEFQIEKKKVLARSK